MTKRKYNEMRRFRIDEISGVDSPAQKGARVVLRKRDSQKQPTGDSSVDQNTPTIESVTKQLADSQAALALQTSLAGMSDAEKAHFGKLDESGKAEFLKASPESRKSELTKIAEGNPVVYKNAEGVEFRKSDDPRLVEMAKRLDSETKTRRETEEKVQKADLEKRAATEMPNLPGSVDVKCAVLKALDGIADEAVRKGAQELVKAGDSAIKLAFVNKGTSLAPAEGSPQAQLEALAKARAAEKKIDFYKAYAEVAEENTALAESAINQKQG